MHKYLSYKGIRCYLPGGFLESIFESYQCLAKKTKPIQSQFAGLWPENLNPKPEISRKGWPSHETHGFRRKK